MTDEPKTNRTWRWIKEGVLALCLISMVAGFMAFGALGYQGWKLFHNPYLTPAQRAQAPSAEAAEWAAGVYRREKGDHLFYTGLFEAALVALATGSWFLYRALDKRLQRLQGAKATPRQR